MVLVLSFQRNDRRRHCPEERVSGNISDVRKLLGRKTTLEYNRRDVDRSVEIQN